MHTKCAPRCTPLPETSRRSPRCCRKRIRGSHDVSLQMPHANASKQAQSFNTLIHMRAHGIHTRSSSQVTCYEASSRTSIAARAQTHMGVYCSMRNYVYVHVSACARARLCVPFVQDLTCPSPSPGKHQPAHPRTHLISTSRLLSNPPVHHSTHTQTWHTFTCRNFHPASNHATVHTHSPTHPLSHLFRVCMRACVA